MRRLCPYCGINFGLVSERLHDCPKKPRLPQGPSPHAVTTSPSVTTKGVTTPPAPVTMPKRAPCASDKARVYQWRANNREHYNAYMRKLRSEKAS